MNREIHHWYSPCLNKNMEIAMYGHYGLALLMFPTAAADYLEYERFELIEAIRKPIDEGKVKVFSINSINAESWLNKEMLPHHKAMRHNDFNAYVANEVVPFIQDKTSWDTPIITCGASLGALHAANNFFRRPDLFAGTIAMSGVYDLKVYTDGFHNEDVFFNSPMEYLPGLTDAQQLSQLRQSGHIHILAGSGHHERPRASRDLSNLLHFKGIPHNLDIWGDDIEHDWPTWRKMLPYLLETKF